MKNEEYNFKITKEDKEIIKVLRKKHSVNISNFLREALRDLYAKLNKK